MKNKKNKNEFEVNSVSEKMDYRNKKYNGWGICLLAIAVAVVIIVPIVLLIAFK